MIQITFVFLLLFLLIIPASGFVFAEHIFSSNAYAQYLDISQLESDKITLEFDKKSYDFYYGYHGSLDSIGSDDVFPTLSSMNINENNKSLEITMSEVPERSDFWVRMPEEVISAENEKFTVLINGRDTGYDLMKFPNDYVIGFFITEDTKKIEIIGTRVIPEFDEYAVLILGISIFSLICFFFVKKYPFGRYRLELIK